MKQSVNRMDVLTREVKDQKSLIRFVILEGVPTIDPTYKLNGRGYYISRDIDKIEEAKRKNSLKKILKIDIPDSFYDSLIDFIRKESHHE